MADGIAVTPGAGATVATDEVTGLTPTLSSTSQVQFIKLVDGTPDSVNKAFIGSNGAQAFMPATDGISSAGVQLTPKRASTNVASATTNGSVVALVAGKKIRVVQLIFTVGSTATNVTFNTLTAGTAISPTFVNDAYGGGVLPFSPMGWFETSTGEGLGVTTTTGSTAAILVGYIEV